MMDVDRTRTSFSRCDLGWRATEAWWDPKATTGPHYLLPTACSEPKRRVKPIE